MSYGELAASWSTERDVRGLVRWGRLLSAACKRRGSQAVGVMMGLKRSLDRYVTMFGY
jgi:hypothetical protein